MAKRKAGRSKRKLPEKIRKVDFRFLRFGKRIRQRGKYRLQVYDRKGRLAGSVPWSQTVRVRLREDLAALQGEMPKRVKKRLAVKGWEVERGSYDPESQTARWSRTVFSTRRGVPVGVPGGHTGGRQKGRSGRWLGAVFDRIDPWAEWPGIIEALPKRFQGYGSNVRCRVRVRDRDGNIHTVLSSTDWFPGTLQLPQHYRSLLSDALSQAGQRYGYAGAVELLGVDLVFSSESEEFVTERESYGSLPQRRKRRKPAKRKKPVKRKGGRRK